MAATPQRTNGAGPAAGARAGGTPGGLGEREKWGYIFWGLAGLSIAIPEAWAAFATPPWPTISAMVGHLEVEWSGVAVIVVALITATAMQAVVYPWGRTGQIAARAGGRVRGRTACGRLTKDPGQVTEVPALGYLAVAAVVVAAGAGIAAAAGVSGWVLGYVLYGLIAAFMIVLPDSLAFWFARDVQFPTLLRAIADVQRRWHPAALVLGASLAVLLLHLALFPWPDVFGSVTMGTP